MWRATWVRHWLTLPTVPTDAGETLADAGGWRTIQSSQWDGRIVVGAGLTEAGGDMKTSTFDILSLALVGFLAVAMWIARWQSPGHQEREPEVSAPRRGTDAARGAHTRPSNMRSLQSPLNRRRPPGGHFCRVPGPGSCARGHRTRLL